jgi:hypothetical protein
MRRHRSDDAAARMRLLQPMQQFALLTLPDGLLAVVFAVTAAFDFLPAAYVSRIPMTVLAMREQLAFALMVEAGFLMMQGTLVDIATRLRKRPPVWAVVLIAGGVLLFSDYAHAVIRMAWDRGMVVFIPLLFSLADRAAVLWVLPRKTQVEKIAARALISNRIVTALALVALFAVSAVLAMALPRVFDSLSGAWFFLSLGCVYFGIAAFDNSRVRGRAFAERPSVLFRYDLLGIEYLEPV